MVEQFRTEFLRNSFFGIVAIIVISFLSIGSIIETKNMLKSTNQETDSNLQNFIELHRLVNAVFTNVLLIKESKGKDRTQYLDKIRLNNIQFSKLSKALITANSETAWLNLDIRNIQQDIANFYSTSIDTAMALIENKEAVAKDNEELLEQQMESLKNKLGLVTAKLRNIQETKLFDFIRDLVIFILLTTAITVLLLSVYAWVSSKNIGNELRQCVSGLYRNSDQNIESTKSLREASQNLSSASTEQSAAVQETVASITEIRGMLSQTSNYVKESQYLSESVSQKTADGSSVMKQMELSMAAIESSNSQLQQVEEIINGIKIKTQVINDIVFKTQLLSFNASIEAARAGQYGRGFAVVAEEVGNLAQLSGKASKEIDILIHDSQKRVGKIIASVQEKVVDGKTVAQNALKHFEEIAGQVVVISEKVKNVGEATLEQEGGIDQTTRAMEEMDKSAGRNKIAADQILKLAEQSRIVGKRIEEVSKNIHNLVGGSDVEDGSTPLEEVDSETEQRTAESQRNDAVTISIIDKLAKQKLKNYTTMSGKGIAASDKTFRKKS